MIAPTLHTERLTLRAPCAADFTPFAEFYASDRAKFVGGPLTSEGAWRMLAMEIGHWTLKGFGRWIAEEKSTGAPVGLIGLFEPFGWPEPEIGWDLFAGFEGKGYATEAALSARSYAYDVLGWTTAISLVKTANTGSARVATRMGAWHDSDYTHERHGFMHVYRHPAPDALVNGGIEAYT
ncbi:GNAT family N-acetyltransferase [Thalassovita taeanensis]|uniref:Protein N-acetyltransferase, RimJ/RimL family n=1 Tax=Thalassovita taeanensis TaxID=657014 RepID=A0A1H9DJ28_9RHOB|nr:GNAT family N-acetyltransferase [Thalassovita taeanensis]SEQ13327.1 Protein N-acetyltransferase, RimJ/RimL family [Thalassovita taeanensis]